MTNLTEELARLNALDAKRTQGEWRLNDQRDSGWMENAVYVATTKGNIIRVYKDFGNEIDEAAFIAAAPDAIALANKLHGLLVQAEAALSEANCYDCLTPYEDGCRISCAEHKEAPDLDNLLDALHAAGIGRE